MIAPDTFSGCMTEISLLKVGLAHGSLALLTFLHAWQLNRQFFPTCIYLMKSSLSMVILVTFGIYLMIVLANCLRLILFGQLRPIEKDHLHEYGWMTVSESFLAMTIFRNEFDAKFAFIFASLIICKGFHWIARDRVDYMEQAIRLPDGFHVKVVTAVYILAVTDFVGAALAISDVVLRGPSMSILAANECCLMLVSLGSTFTRYVLNLNDLRRDAPWENRSVVLFYLDFAFDLSKLLIYMFYFAVIVSFYGLPVHIIRDLYLTFRSFVIRVNDIIRYRQATADMENKYPTVTAEELEASPDKVCIICREEMEIGQDGPKKLPCGHFFHLRCLRSWLERQQACPTCRKSVIQPRNVAQQYPGNVNRPAQENAQPHGHPQGHGPERPEPTRTVPELVRMTESSQVTYVASDNIVPAEERQGQFVLKNTQGTANPVYLERVNVLTQMDRTDSAVFSLSDSSQISLFSTSATGSKSIDEQLGELDELEEEIAKLRVKAHRIRSSLDKVKE